MEKLIVTIKHKEKKHKVQLCHNHQKMTIHFTDQELKREFHTNGFAINSSWELIMDQAMKKTDPDQIRQFFIKMLDQKNDLVNYFG